MLTYFIVNKNICYIELVTGGGVGGKRSKRAKIKQRAE